MKKRAIFAAVCIATLTVVALYYVTIVMQTDIQSDPDVATSGPVAEAVILSPVEHSSFALKLNEVLIFNDPLGDVEIYTEFGEPDIILLSDIHPDHIDLEVLGSVIAANTIVVAPPAVVDLLTPAIAEQVLVMQNGESLQIESIDIEAVPMYNLPEQGFEIRHEKGRGNGYILTARDTRVYIAGDTAATPEMKAVTDIDIAFVPMNPPYTMTVEDAAEAVLAFAPKTVYPYHYRTPDGLSDVKRFKELVTDSNPDINVELLIWYPEIEGPLTEIGIEPQ